MADEKRTSQTMIRTKPSLKAVAARAAADDGRTLSALIEKLLIDHLRAKGYFGSDETSQGQEK